MLRAHGLPECAPVAYQMSRCAKCNGEGYEKRTVEEARATGRVQEKVLSFITEYWQCKKCKKLYWCVCV